MNRAKFTKLKRYVREHYRELDMDCWNTCLAAMTLRMEDQYPTTLVVVALIPKRASQILGISDLQSHLLFCKFPNSKSRTKGYAEDVIHNVNQFLRTYYPRPPRATKKAVEDVISSLEPQRSKVRA